MKLPSRAAGAFTVLAAAATATAHAATIDFTFTGVADFTVAGTPYPARSFVVSMQGDTADRFTLNIAGVTHVYPALATVLQIDGVGTGTFANEISPFTNQATQSVGFSDPAGDLLGLYNATLSTYDMLSSLAPISGVPYVPRPWLDQPTSFGNLSATGFNSITFSALLSPVPEPTPGLMLAAGLLAIAGMCRRRRQPAA